MVFHVVSSIFFDRLRVLISSTHHLRQQHRLQHSFPWRRRQRHSRRFWKLHVEEIQPKLRCHLCLRYTYKEDNHVLMMIITVIIMWTRGRFSYASLTQWVDVYNVCNDCAVCKTMSPIFIHGLVTCVMAWYWIIVNVLFVLRWPCVVDGTLTSGNSPVIISMSVNVVCRWCRDPFYHTQHLPLRQSLNVQCPCTWRRDPAHCLHRLQGSGNLHRHAVGLQRHDPWVAWQLQWGHWRRLRSSRWHHFGLWPDRPTDLRRLWTPV